MTKEAGLNFEPWPGGKWEIVATYYTGDRWSELIPIPESVGRNEGELQIAADTAGNCISRM